jgi:hypothetical protein
VYFAAHDPHAETKTFHCKVELDGTSSLDGVASFGVSATPPNAGLRLDTHPFSCSYPLVVAPFRGDWWDASQLYRAWALQGVSLSLLCALCRDLHFVCRFFFFPVPLDTFNFASYLPLCDIFMCRCGLDE